MAETMAEPGAMVFVPPDVDNTRVYHGFIPAGFEPMLVERGARTELMTLPIGEAPFDPATAMIFGIHLVAE